MKARKLARRLRQQNAESQEERDRKSVQAGLGDVEDAAACGDVERLREILERPGSSGCRVTDERGGGALSWAAEGGHVECVQLLLSSGAPVDHVDVYGRSAVWVAAAAGHAAVVSVLAARGADMSLRPPSGETALWAACAGGHSRVVEALLGARAAEQGANALGRTPLMSATCTGSVECVRLLLAQPEHGLGARDAGGASALDMAAETAQVACLDALLSAALDGREAGEELVASAAEVAERGGFDELADSVRLRLRLARRGRIESAALRRWSPTDAAQWLEAVGVELAGAGVDGPALVASVCRVDSEAEAAAWLGRIVGADVPYGDCVHVVRLLRALNARPHTNEPSLQFIPFEELDQFETLGEGHFAWVRRADWHGTNVAVKLLKTRDDSFDALAYEASMLARLRHPNVLLIVGVTRSPDGRPGIVTEYLAGNSLRLFLDHNSNRHDGALRRRILMDVVRGLTYMHRHDPVILHRDLSSYNVLLDSVYNAKVADFGLSRPAGASLGAGFGRVAWMAPEVLAGGSFSIAADVYSLGILIYEVVTLRLPNEALLGDAVDLEPATYAMRVIDGARPPLDHVPHDWAAVIQHCWSANPATRPTLRHLQDRIRTLEAPDCADMPSPSYSPTSARPGGYLLDS